MRSNLEARSFVALDVAGNPYRVVASRVLGPARGQDRPAPWEFRTGDGRSGRPTPAYHRYTVSPTTSP